MTPGIGPMPSLFMPALFPPRYKDIPLPHPLQSNLTPPPADVVGFDPRPPALTYRVVGLSVNDSKYYESTDLDEVLALLRNRLRADCAAPGDFVSVLVRATP